MPAIATNNAKSTLSSALSNTSMTVSVADGSSFPTPSTGEYFYVTLVDSSNNTEIVKCTVRAGNGMTILRGQDGTTASAHVAGSDIGTITTADNDLIEVGDDFGFDGSYV